MMTSEQISTCKTALLARQTNLINQVHTNLGLSDSERDSVGELSSYDNHPADMGTETFERSKDLALNEHVEKELEEINESLHAIDEGTYGICAVCGGDIPYERLTAVLTADRCTHHSEEETLSRDRPIEETVLQPNINAPIKDIAEEQVGYDREDAWQEVSRYGTSETPSDFYGDRDNYNEMYPNSDERIGSTELAEEVSANIHGKQIDDQQEFD